MFFSLVVMTYERPSGLRRCLQALADLDYARDAFEVVVIDDGSMPPVDAIVGELAGILDIRSRRIPNGGVAVARNAGLAMARGDYVAFLADDYAVPRAYLRRAAAFFRERPTADVLSFNMRSRGPSVARHVQQMYMELALLQNAGGEPDTDGVIRSFSLPASRAAIFRRVVFDRVGRFDERLRAGEDGDMAARLADAGIPVHFLPDFYVDHWEEKSFGEFLRQRVAYATSFHALLQRRAPDDAGRIRWTLRKCLRMIADRIGPWARLSWRTGRGARFALVLPGLLLFLGTFYGTMYRCERRLAREEGHRAMRR